MVLFHIHNASGGVLPDAPFDAEYTFPWVMDQVLQGESVIIADTEALPPEAEQDSHSFLRWRIKACFVAPLVSGGRVIGALSFCNLRQKRKWTESIVQKLS
jgi:GAF domain-containing protein